MHRFVVVLAGLAIGGNAQQIRTANGQVIAESADKHTPVEALVLLLTSPNPNLAFKPFGNAGYLPMQSSIDAGLLFARGRARTSRIAMNAADQGVDVSDLGLTMEDLDAALPESAGSALASSGYESTSQTPGSTDQGCYWRETAETVDVTLTIPGLRGQPSAAMAVDLTANTATVTVFGQAVWSCVLRGDIDVTKSSAEAGDGADMLPLLNIEVTKRAGAPRWGGFIRSIGVDSILQ